MSHLLKFKKLSLVLFLFFGLIFLAGAPVVMAVDLLINGPFEAFHTYNGKEWRGFSEKTGAGWTVRVLDEEGLHFMDSDTFGQFLTAVYGVPYLNYHLEGGYAQSFASRRAYNFVFSQTVTVSNGQDYTFGGKIVTFWKGSGGERDDTKIFKRIGLDPTGGTDYSSSAVIWTEWEGTDNAWTSPALAATAQADQMTVYFQVNNTGDDVGAAYLNTGYIDNFKFELAPVATLNLPGQAAPGSVNVTWSASIPDPNYWTLWGYDVQYKEGTNGAWQTIQTHDGSNNQNTGYALQAEAGETYTFRVRPWQERPGGDAATTALPGIWQEKSVTIGQAVVGRVIDHAGVGLNDVTVSISGTNESTVSINGGNYLLPTGDPGTFAIVASDFNGLSAPPATLVTVPSAEEIGTLTITMRPPDNIITDNDFESGLSSWNISSGAAAGVSEEAWHTGRRSLRISDTVSISQTGVVSGMANPLLSFWYKSEAGFSVEFLGEASANPIQTQAVEPVQTQNLDPVADWTHVTLELGTSDVYSGELGVNFAYSGGSGANIFIDEVSIGAGPYKIFLPVVVKN